MPWVRIEIRKGRSPSEKKALLEAVHSALVEAIKIPDKSWSPRDGIPATEMDLGFKVNV